MMFGAAVHDECPDHDAGTAMLFQSGGGDNGPAALAGITMSAPATTSLPTMSVTMSAITMSVLLLLCVVVCSHLGSTQACCLRETIFSQLLPASPSVQ